jgi:hypothetical protein
MIGHFHSFENIQIGYFLRGGPVTDHLSWRIPAQRDLETCLQLHPAKMGAERIGVARAIKAWREVLEGEETSKSALVERTSASGGEIVGFGISAFVKQSFADREVAHPEPGLNMRIIESIDSGRSVIPSYRELREANTGGKLQQVILYTSWQFERALPEEVDEIRSLLAQAYLQIHAGYRLSRMLTELVDDYDLRYIKDFPGIRTLSRFGEFFSKDGETTWNRNRALAETTADTLRADPGSVATGLFHRRSTPIFGFAAGEQKLLETALRGYEDAELAESLLRSLPAVKRRWASIFSKVSDKRPDLCPAVNRNFRGPQKRYRVLAYVREHPEELRPYLSPAVRCG